MSEYESFKRLKLIGLCKTRGIEYSDVPKGEEDILRSRLTAYDSLNQDTATNEDAPPISGTDVLPPTDDSINPKPEEDLDTFGFELTPDAEPVGPETNEDSVSIGPQADEDFSTSGFGEVELKSVKVMVAGSLVVDTPVSAVARIAAAKQEAREQAERAEMDRAAEVAAKENASNKRELAAKAAAEKQALEAAAIEAKIKREKQEAEDAIVAEAAAREKAAAAAAKAAADLVKANAIKFKSTDIDRAVKVAGYSGLGWIRYVGPHLERDGKIRIGVEMATRVGRNDGSLPGGGRYFRCKQGFGVICAPNRVEFSETDPTVELNNTGIIKSDVEQEQAAAAEIVLTDIAKSTAAAKAAAAADPIHRTDLLSASGGASVSGPLETLLDAEPEDSAVNIVPTPYTDLPEWLVEALPLTAFKGSSLHHNEESKPENATFLSSTGWLPSVGLGDGDLEDRCPTFEVDLGHLCYVGGIATKGHGGSSHWMEKYYIHTSIDGIHFQNVREGEPFEGNTDCDTPKMTVLPGDPCSRETMARFIRVVGVYNKFKVSGLRIEVFGRKIGRPVGLGSGDYPKGKIAASSEKAGNLGKESCRLGAEDDRNKCIAWQPDIKDTAPTIEFDLSGVYGKNFKGGSLSMVTAVGVQGRETKAGQFCTSFTIAIKGLYTGEWKEISDEFGEAIVWEGNTNSTGVQVLLMTQPTLCSALKLIPMSWHNACSLRAEIYTVPLGTPFEVAKLPDSAFSSSLPLRPLDTAAHFAKLFGGGVGGGWVAAQDTNTYLRVDLGRIVRIRGISTQGRAKMLDQWTESYFMKSSVDGIHFKPYVYLTTNSSFEFTGNEDRNTVSVQLLPRSLIAQHLHFAPLAYHRKPALRVEVYAEDIGETLGWALGGELPNDAAVCTGGGDPVASRLNSELVPGGWIPDVSDSSQCLEINLGDLAEVHAVIVQGRFDGEEWVEEYTIDLTVDGVNWNSYCEGGKSPKKFQGNTDADSSVIGDLQLPSRARAVRIRPTKWIGQIAMRVELVGKARQVPKRGDTSVRLINDRPSWALNAGLNQTGDMGRFTATGDLFEHAHAAKMRRDSSRTFNANDAEFGFGSNIDEYNESNVEDNTEDEIPDEPRRGGKPVKKKSREVIAVERAKAGQAKDHAQKNAVMEEQNNADANKKSVAENKADAKKKAAADKLAAKSAKAAAAIEKKEAKAVAAAAKRAIKDARAAAKLKEKQDKAAAKAAKKSSGGSLAAQYEGMGKMKLIKQCRVKGIDYAKATKESDPIAQLIALLVAADVTEKESENEDSSASEPESDSKSEPDTDTDTESEPELQTKSV